jgi:hypothetical protein
MGITFGHKQDLDILILDTQTPRQRHTMTGFVFDVLSCSSRIGTKDNFGELQNAPTIIISIIFTNIAFIGLQRRILSANA